ncbi:MAG: Rieske (2Fe-2S) protein [Chloroflexota bacterium]
MTGAATQQHQTAGGTTMHDIGPAELIPPGEGRNVRLGDEQIAVFHTRSGAFYATQALCPHRGGPLADGIVGGGAVVCPLHEYRFDLGSGAPLGNDCPALRRYRVEVSREGRLLVGVESDE